MTNSIHTHEVSLQEGYKRWATQYDREENALIVLEEALTLPLLSTIPIHHVLDLGAGTGRYALRLAGQGAQVMALDQAEAMLAIARQAAGQAGLSIQFLQRGLEGVLPGEVDSFDLVLAALVLCHVADLTGPSREAYRVVRPGGHILITDFHPAVIAAGWRTQFTNETGTYFLPTANHTRDDYLTALTEAGFHVQTVQEGLVRDIPPNLISAEMLAQDGDKPFCLVILAAKPSHGK